MFLAIGTLIELMQVVKYIAYCFAEKKGFSKFGSYTGNGNAQMEHLFIQDLNLLWLF
jgi:hypothetical protein